MNVVYERKSGTPLTPERFHELNALEGRPIDTSDIPELSPGAWKTAIRGRFYRPSKPQIVIR